MNSGIASEASRWKQKRGDARRQSPRLVSIRLFSNPVARRSILAYPDFAVSAPGHRASHFFGIVPDNLRIMPANAATDVGIIVIVPDFAGPCFDYFGGVCRGTLNFV